jgi:hypothetical protein
MPTRQQEREEQKRSEVSEHIPTDSSHNRDVHESMALPHVCVVIERLSGKSEPSRTNKLQTSELQTSGKPSNSKHQKIALVWSGLVRPPAATTGTGF